MERSLAKTAYAGYPAMNINYLLKHDLRQPGSARSREWHIKSELEYFCKKIF